MHLKMHLIMVIYKKEKKNRRGFNDPNLNRLPSLIQSCDARSMSFKQSVKFLPSLIAPPPNRESWIRP